MAMLLVAGNSFKNKITSFAYFYIEDEITTGIDKITFEILQILWEALSNDFILVIKK